MKNSLAFWLKLLSLSQCQEVNTIFASSHYEYLLAHKVRLNDIELKIIQILSVFHPISSIIFYPRDSTSREKI